MDRNWVWEVIGGLLRLRVTLVSRRQSLHVDDSVEYLYRTLENWLDLLQNRHSALHVLNLWLEGLNHLKFARNFDHGLVAVQFLQNACRELFLDVFDCLLLGRCSLGRHYFWIGAFLRLSLGKHGLHHR